MNVLNRPLFRQAGGPAQPMPQDMMPPQGMPQGMPEDPQQAIQGFEQQAADQMKQVGQQYAMETMANLDAAQTPKDVIDALRGTSRPIEERYAELAQFVGEEDAAATPESVLALVQPTIMLTEEGAMDTGIGQLIQSIAGSDMSGGMEQGVGSLMMAGAQEAPAPQNFNQGGPVRKFAEGGAAEVPSRAGNIRTAYEGLLPLYQEILGRTDEDKKLSKAGAYFDLASAGLALAGGVDPRTGQSMAGAPLAAQLARAAAPLPQQFSARAAAERDAQRQIQGMALQGAMSQEQADQGFLRELMLAKAKEKQTPKSPELYRVGDQTFNINDPEGLNAALKAEQTTGTKGYKVSTEPTPSSLPSPVLYRVGDKTFNIKDPTELADARKMEQETGTKGYMVGVTPKADDGKPSLSSNEIRGLFSDTERVKSFAQGQDDYEMLTAIADYTKPETNPITGAVTRAELPPQILEAMASREAALGGEDKAAEKVAIESTAVNDADAKAAERGAQIITGDVDLSEATGALSDFKAWSNSLAGLLSEFGVGKGVFFKDTAAGRTQLNSLNTEFINYLVEGRTLAKQLERYESTLPDPATVRTDFEAQEAIKSLLGGLTMAEERISEILANPTNYRDIEVSTARIDLAFIKQLKSNYLTAQEVYEKALNMGKENRAPLSTFYKTSE